VQPQQPSAVPVPAFRRVVARIGRFLISAMKIFVIVLLVIIPVPVATLFTNLLKTRRRSDSAQVLKKE
jgi:hypothetical protein